MFRSNGINLRATLLAVLITATMVAPVMAQQQATSAGLGRAWPTDVRDQSIAPGWHVYTWVKGGVKYIQINDNAGTVHAALATANGQFLVLPMGVDAARVSTPAQPLAPTTSVAPATPIYNDKDVKIKATPQSDGTTRFSGAMQSADYCPGCGGNSPQVQ